MKKTFILLTIVSFSLATYAQKSFQLGLQVSPNLSWVKPNSENLERDGLKFGFNFGLIGDFNFADNYSFSTGIGLANAGGKFIKPDVQTIDNVSRFGKTETDLRLKYIEVPLTLKLKTNEIGYMKYFAQVGFGIAYNYDAVADEKFNYVSDPALVLTGGSRSNEDVDYSDEVNALRASLILGLGAEYNLSGNTSLLLGITFNNGFTNVFSEDTYSADENGNAVVARNVDGTNNNDRNEDGKAVNNYLLINVGVLF